jgi:phosphate starvation-inducible membrane PsiE
VEAQKTENSQGNTVTEIFFFFLYFTLINKTVYIYNALHDVLEYVYIVDCLNQGN